MSRYITPSKICLLALIDVYLEGSVPWSSAVPVLSFITLNVLPSKKSPPSPLSLSSFEETLSSHQSSVPGRSIWDHFLGKIWDIDCADNFYAFFDDLGRMIDQPKRPDDEEEEEEPKPKGVKLTKSSPLGTFVRRSQVEFTRLNFQDSIQLWKNFVAYREPSHSLWAKRSGSILSKSAIDSNLLEMADMRIQDITYGNLPDLATAEAKYSTEDVERLLDYYVAEVSKTGTRLPEEIRDKFLEMSVGSITIPSASYYIQYLDAWKADDYPAALDSLHRYFDYSIQTREKSHYQYALLNMALLHAHFGSFSEAISALQETVATARENKDTACLNYSLSWLYHFGQAHPSETSEIQKSGVLGRGKEALAFLQSKARESSSWALLSSSLVADARLSMTQGDGLAGAVENLVRASHLNLVKKLPAAIGNTIAMESALWKRLGVGALADAKDEIYAECYAADGAHIDAIQAICRRAGALADQGRYADAVSLMEREPDPASMRTNASQTAWSVCLGQIKLLHSIRRRDWRAADIYLGQLYAMTGSDISKSSASSSSADPNTRFNISNLRIRLLLARGELSDALDQVEATSLAVDAARADVLHRVRLMLIKAAIWAKAGQAARGFSVVMRACSLASSARLLPLLWEGITALGNILNTLGEFTAAGELLLSTLPQVLACRDCELAARAYAVLADSHVGLAGRVGRTDEEGQAKDGDDGIARPQSQGSSQGQGQGQTLAQIIDATRKEEIGKALEYLARAFDEWSAVEDVAGQTETLAKRSMLMHFSGDTQLANDCAAQYKDIREKHREELKT